MRQDGTHPWDTFVCTRRARSQKTPHRSSVDSKQAVNSVRTVHLNVLQHFLAVDQQEGPRHALPPRGPAADVPARVKQADARRVVHAERETSRPGLYYMQGGDEDGEAC